MTQAQGHWSREVTGRKAREDQAGAYTRLGPSLPSLPWPHLPLVPHADPTDDIGEDRGGEADGEASGLGEPLVKRERSDPNPSLQGV